MSLPPLRLATVGSVDDGKSTLVGRLLLDTDSVLDDQLVALDHASTTLGRARRDLSLVTDGLRAERAGGITIDVAYRFIRTARRAFVFVDTPGHAEYTRNMVTGASHVDAAIVVIDAERGPRRQTKRHVHVLGLLGVRHVVVAVNKMDAVGFSRERFDEVARSVLEFVRHAGIASSVALPVSALEGDNVSAPSPRLEWFSGPTLLDHLETLELDVHDERGPLRLPVQLVLEHDGCRWLAGRLASGTIAVGDTVRVSSGGGDRGDAMATVTDVLVASRPLPAGERSAAAASVAVRLADETSGHVAEAGRGTMLADAERPPLEVTTFSADVAWLRDEPLEAGSRWLLKHESRIVSATVTGVSGVRDLESGDVLPATQIDGNDIGVVSWSISAPASLPLDTFANVRSTGAVVVIDPESGSTVGAGIVTALNDAEVA